jgi:hypothetical protein
VDATFATGRRLHKNIVVRRLSSDVYKQVVFCSSKDTSLKAIIGNPKSVLKEFKCIFSLMNKYALNSNCARE